MNQIKTCWVPSKTESWELANILSENEDGTVTVETLSKQEQKSFPRSSTHRSDPSHFVDHEDLCFMNHLHEAPLLDCLRRRFAQDKIYTTTGDVLISVNPYKHIPGLYESIVHYLNLPEDGFIDPSATGPHVYKIANQALVEMMHGKHGAERERDARNQSIVVSGESGAGKTEASKHVMHFLIEADQESGGLSAQSAETDLLGDKIKRVLLQSNLILEAFGNSKTVRNDNSSRFGKYIKLQYSAQNRLVSAYTETFLLEKSRLMNISANERNYHIFYQFLRHNNSPELVEKLCLQDPVQFRMLVDANGAALPSGEDVHFADVLQALRTLNTSEEEIESLLTLLAVILHCGNISCEEIDESKHTDTQDEGVLGNMRISCSTASLAQLTAMLGIPSNTFVGKLTTQRVRAGTRRSVSFKKLSQSEVLNNVAALIKWLYSSLFHWLVRKINFAHCSLNEDENVQAKRFIGILDIFGFEILQNNSFEQLCINFTNERLQQQFNEFVFDREQAVYAQEGIDWRTIDYRDNQLVIDLIGKKPAGLLLLLEGQGMLNRGGSADEQALVSAFNQAHDKKNNAYEKSRFANDGKFSIKHFAGDVTYSVAGFLDKNNDALQDDLLELMLCSSNAFVQNAIVAHSVAGAGAGAPTLAPSALGHCGFVAEISPEKIVKSIPDVAPALVSAVAETASASPAGPTGTGSRASVSAGRRSTSTVQAASKKTVSAQFRGQLDLLLSTLRATSPHYVKCVKPNTLKQAGVFDGNMVLEQLKYSGALEVVRIRQEGFPINMSFPNFLETFVLLAPRRNASAEKESNELSDTVRRLCAEHLVEKKDFQVGHSKVFLRAEAFERMFSLVQRAVAALLSRLQRRVRRFLAQRRWRRRVSAATKLQSCIRMHTERKIYLVMLEEERERRRREEEERLRKIREAEEAAERERERQREIERQREEELARIAREKALEEEREREKEQERAEREKQQQLFKEKEEKDREKQREREQELERAKERAREQEKEKEKEKEKENSSSTSLPTATAAVSFVAPAVVRESREATALPAITNSTEATHAAASAQPLRDEKNESSERDESLSLSLTPAERLHRACLRGDFATVRSLWPDALSESAQCSVWHSLCASGDDALLASLSPSLEDLCVRDAHNNTPLHYALSVHTRTDGERDKNGVRELGGALRVLRYAAQLAENDAETIAAVEREMMSARNLSAIRPRVVSPSLPVKIAHEKKSDAKEKTVSSSVRDSQNAHTQHTVEHAHHTPHYATHLKRGWLSKKGETQAWQRRWVVLSTHSLMYFRSEKDWISRDTIPFAFNTFTVEQSTQHRHAFEIMMSSCTAKKKRDRVCLMADSEEDMLEWMNLFKSAVGLALPPLRPAPAAKNDNIEKPLCVVHVQERERLFSMVNAQRETLLHTLCARDWAKEDRETRHSAIALAVWLVHNGCPVNAADATGRTALRVAVERENEELAIALAREGADPNWVAPGQRRNSAALRVAQSRSQDLKLAMERAFDAHTRDEIPLPVKNFHYLSIFFAHSLLDEKDFFIKMTSVGERILRVSAYTPGQVRIGSAVEYNCRIADSASTQQQRWTWASFFQLSLPLENLQAGSYLRVEILDVSRVVVLARAKMSIDKTTVNTETLQISLSSMQSASRVHSVLELETSVVHAD